MKHAVTKKMFFFIKNSLQIADLKVFTAYDVSILR
jgi:hypothetical protein